MPLRYSTHRRAPCVRIQASNPGTQHPPAVETILMNAKPHPPLWQWSATDLAKAIREKTRSSQEVIQAHLDRIDAVNPAVNAVTVVLEDDALRMAREADEKIAAGESVGRLHGVPITVKESFDVVGSATTHGIVALKDSMSQTDAPVVAHLKQAGSGRSGRRPRSGPRSQAAHRSSGRCVRRRRRCSPPRRSPRRSACSTARPCRFPRRRAYRS